MFAFYILIRNLSWRNPDKASAWSCLPSWSLLIIQAVFSLIILVEDSLIILFEDSLIILVENSFIFLVED